MTPTGAGETPTPALMNYLPRNQTQKLSHFSNAVGSASRKMNTPKSLGEDPMNKSMFSFQNKTSEKGEIKPRISHSR